MRTLVALAIMVSLLAVACGGDAADCDELADEAIGLIQQLIDDVEDEFGDEDLDTVLAQGTADLPSVEAYQEQADRLDERADVLQCTNDQMRSLVAQRAGSLEADTPVGRFLIEVFASESL